MTADVAARTYGDLPGRGVLRRFAEHLPITERTPMISLGEGDTPLVRSTTIERDLGCKALYFKLESCNPTGSFKDRGMVVAVAKAMEDGARAIMCASTGNTSASAAAYAGRYGLAVYVIVPEGKIARGKLAQGAVHGAEIIAIDGNFDAALRVAREVTSKHPIALVNSVNPFRIEGQKTAAFEIADALGDAPDVLALPVGNAGNITAYWKGFVEYNRMERTSLRPRMLGFQAAGAAPLVQGAPVADPQTLATAIRIGNPASWKTAIAARDESGGSIDAVTDDEILAAYGRLAREEGVFCEPASAACVAGLLQKAAAGTSFAGKTIVCIITGNGLKDPETALRVEPPIHHVAADLELIEREMGWA
ncbi:MAG: threonine synthase [Chloroflexi bacterium]|nr:threonine synthase [Chloroflexota bacterium]